MTDSSMHNFDELEQQLGVLARSITDDDWHLEAPPADLFPAIMADIETGGETSPSELFEQAPRTLDVRDHGVFGNGHGPSSSGPDRQSPQTHKQGSTERPVVDSDPAPVADLGARRQARQDRREPQGSRAPWLLAAAAVVAILAVGGGALAGLFSPGDAPGADVATATIVNDELPVAFGESGVAVLRDDNGDLVLDIDVPPLPDSGEAFYEVWMIDANVEGMISLGVLTADGRVDVPDSIDPADFPVVDLSVEPLDGDPTHSGQSILRGVLNL